MGVRVHIEELVLYGFDRRDRHTVADVVRAELARLLREPSARPLRSGTVDHAEAGEVHVGDIRSPEAPRAIAGAVYREVTR